MVPDNFLKPAFILLDQLAIKSFPSTKTLTKLKSRAKLVLLRRENLFAIKGFMHETTVECGALCNASWDLSILTGKPKILRDTV